MRGLFVSLIVAALFLLIALLVTGLGALGVALIGLLLSRWFELTQWQGSLIALVMAASLTVLVYRLTHTSPVPSVWSEDWEEEEEEEEEAEEPPIVPWRRNRPTPGELPAERSTGCSNKSTSSSKRH